ncbi:MAG TPA: hypothetical protein VMG37_01195 [Solirubrobacteraceae bacterium]|nr:hypothetical protein [Solirubrobacteraceae bacterium]
MGETAGSREAPAETVLTVSYRPSRAAEEVTMFISEPFIRFESPAVAPVRVSAGFRSLAAVFAVAITLFVVLLAATPAITGICPAPHSDTPVHLAR